MGIGVIGCGYWGANHIKTLASLGLLSAISDYIDENVQIGNNTKIWHFSHILKDSILGKRVVYIIRIRKIKYGTNINNLW
ncbi:hypothetical protein [Candidatus Tisiphia endosymbiont of Nemotelus uliginosus]|uniref:hypothetical protein n=1 Tax=Candidatus Tisiphia endosymbiont of Nemotelus uliginosus TaxID=3077926 RepID=UPI0035C8F72B